MDISTAKSYATEENLVRALRRLGIADDRHLVVRNREGRWTAIFPASNVIGGYIARYAALGFITLG